MRLVTAFCVLALCHCTWPAVIPDITINATVPSPMVAPAGQAMLVFVRPRDVGFQVNVMDTEGRFVTTVARGTFVPIVMAVGAHDFVVFISPWTARPLRTTLTEGKVYFVGIDWTGFWTPILNVHAHRPETIVDGLKAAIPADVDRAQNVLHDTWNVKAVIDRAQAHYDQASADERAACTIAN